MIRIAYSLGLLLLAPIFPWWVFFLLAILGVILFDHYWETIALLFLYDLAFGLPGEGIFKSQFSLTIIGAGIYFLAEAYKDNLRL